MSRKGTTVTSVSVIQDQVFKLILSYYCHAYNFYLAAKHVVLPSISHTRGLYQNYNISSNLFHRLVRQSNFRSPCTTCTG